MAEIKSKYYKKSRAKNLLKNTFKKILQISIMVIIGESMLLKAINISMTPQNPIIFYNKMPAQIISLAVDEKPILRVAEAYHSIKKNIDFDKIIQTQYPVKVKGERADFRTLNLQDKEGAKVGYVVKF